MIAISLLTPVIITDAIREFYIPNYGCYHINVPVLISFTSVYNLKTDDYDFN